MDVDIIFGMVLVTFFVLYRALLPTCFATFNNALLMMMMMIVVINIIYILIYLFIYIYVYFLYLPSIIIYYFDEIDHVRSSFIHFFYWERRVQEEKKEHERRREDLSTKIKEEIRRC